MRRKGGKSQVGVGRELSEPFGWLLGSTKQKLWDRVELQWGGPAYWWCVCGGLIRPPGSYSWSHWRDTIESFVCGPATDSFWFPQCSINTIHIRESTSWIKRQSKKEGILGTEQSPAAGPRRHLRKKQLICGSDSRWDHFAFGTVWQMDAHSVCLPELN